MSNALIPTPRCSKRSVRRLTGTIVLLLVTGPPSRAQGPAARTAQLDSLIRRDMAAQQIPGVAVAVVEDGNLVLARAWGYANLETGTPLDTSAVFELASVTKQFTVAAMMLLVEQGKVSLDDPVSKHLAGTPQAWVGITVRMLLNHTSGLPIDGFPGFEGSPLLVITTRQAFEFIAKQPLVFQPGESAFYSDAGYFLAGMIIEKASGQTYRQVMQQIFDRRRGRWRRS